MSNQNKLLQERAAKVIPNGMYGHMSIGLMPEGTPQFYARAKGSELWDADGKRYVDVMSAFGTNLLGYNDPDVQRAIDAQQALADTTSGPSPLMVDLAETLVSMYAHADWAMFCKNGSDATNMAKVMIRAHTKRRKVLVGRRTYHGAYPWSTPGTSGILPEDRAHLIQFDVARPESLEEAVAAAGDDLAGILTTPYRHEVFEDQVNISAEMARRMRQICDDKDAFLILDEVRTGFRLSQEGSWHDFGVEPDISCWGKGLANGQPISAVMGNDRARAAAGSIYVTGSFWFSAVPMAAALETLRQVREGSYLTRMRRAGDRLRAGLYAQGDAYGFGLRQTGPVTMPQVLLTEDPEFKLGYRFCQLTIEAGALVSPYHNMFMNAAMTDQSIDDVLTATDTAFATLAKERKSAAVPHDKVVDKVASRLSGRPYTADPAFAAE